MQRLSTQRALWLGLVLSTCTPTPVFALPGFDPAAECFDEVPDNVDDAVEPVGSTPSDAPRDTPNRGRTSAQDSDDDGVPDRQDVCAHVSDPNQEDEDGDGVGDACEGRSVWRDHWVIESEGPDHDAPETDEGGIVTPKMRWTGCDIAPDTTTHWLWMWVVIMGAGARRRTRAPGRSDRYSAVSAVRISRRDSSWLEPSA